MKPTIKSIVSLLLAALSASSALAAAVQSSNEDMATFAGVVDFRRPEPPVTTTTTTTKIDGFDNEDIDGGHKLQPSTSTADGSKGTHYGDPAEGCMKDEVRTR